MSRISILLFLFCLAASLAAQCPDNLDVTFLSQADIDDFANNYPNCTTLESISIGSGVQQNNVNNLSPLTGLNVVSDHIDIRGTQLTNLFGLHLVTECFRVRLWYNNVLTDLSGLGNINVSLKQLEVIKNDALQSIGGLENISFSGPIRILDNNLLTECVYDNFCAELALPDADITFSGNAGNCINSLAVKIGCGQESCSPDYAALMNLYFDTGGDLWTNHAGWADGAAETDCDVCNWPGVNCDPIVNRVIGLSLPQNNLQGTLPPEIGELEELRVLQLPANQLSGPFPTTLSNLDFLLNVELNNNDFSGPLPEVLEAISTLQGIILHDNAFTGSLPEAYGNFPLNELDLADNQLTGCYPENYVNLCGSSVNFSGNSGLPASGSLAFFEEDFCTAADLCGPCHPDLEALIAFYEAANGDNWTNNTGWADLSACTPCEWYGVKCDEAGRVVELVLESNNLNGSLASAVADLPELLHLNVNGNNLSGPLPNLSALNKMDTLRLAANDFNGEFPTSILGLTDMTWLALSSNQLSGPLPDLNALTKLRRIYLHENNFTGNLPELSALSDLRVLQLDNNEFNGPIPASWAATNHPFLFRILAGNAGLTGELPVALGELPSLTYLNLRNNNLSGCYPESYASFCGESLLLDGNADLPLAGDISFFEDEFCPSPATACSALPVEFSDLRGVVLDKANRLEWATVREEATAFHHVERSLDGFSWLRIGRLAAAGHSIDLQEYQFTDVNPLLRAYYRIVTEDFDEQTSISSIIPVFRNSTDGLIISNIYPQPTTDLMAVRLVNPEAVSSADFVLFDALGRRMLHQTSTLETGENELRFDVSNLPSGAYWLTILVEGQRVSGSWVLRR